VGFPWNPSAIIYYKNLFVLKSLPILGCYGLGLAIHLVIGLILLVLVNGKRLSLYIIGILVMISFFMGFIKQEHPCSTD
jgi:apolipoprotein N-acyltransferase